MFVTFHTFTLQVMAIGAISENTVEELLEFVEEDKKMRYSVIEENGGLLIRANQGHTIPCVRDEMLMTPITDPAEVNNHSAASLCESECMFGLYLLFVLIKLGILSLAV